MIRLRQIKLKINDNDLKKEIASKLKIKESEILDLKINKKSLDARHKDNLLFVYEVDIKVENENKILNKNKNKDIFKTPKEEYVIELTGKEELKNRPVIIGAGPAGLFSAYLLAEYGYKPIIIERGEKIEDRIKSVEKFWKKGILNPNSNVQFGEGGAGTFSDGKLNTLVKDKRFRMKKVFEIFVENGAPKEIMYENKPHIGTDVLRDVVISIRKKLIEMHVEIKYNTTLTNIICENNKIKQIELNNNEIIDTDVLILAIGHSARDTFRMLEKKLNMQPKPFAVGVRIQHVQKMINKSQYGIEESKYLDPASYKLTYTTSKNRAVYSFCMCPGGYVVNASSSNNMLTINGMSNYKRESKNANSAIVVGITPDDFNNELFGGMKFQEELEKKAYNLGNGNIPVQLYKDYKEDKVSNTFEKVTPVFKGNYTFSNINSIFPQYINESLKEAIEYFDTKIKGFSNDDSIIAAVEARTSSPVRIIRDENYETNIKGIYPAGEGAGYAGGITTSAMDGLKIAEQIIKTYKTID